MRKDHRGAQLIRLLSIPQGDGTFRDDPTLMAEMVAYCEQDVRAMRVISETLRQLSDEELSDYHINERINDRGVRLDVPLAKAAVRYAAQELDDIQQVVQDVTGGALTSVRSPRMREWVWERVGPEARKLMLVEDAKIKEAIKKQEQKEHLVRKSLLGDDIYTAKLFYLESKQFKVSIDKTVRANLLAMENPDEVPAEVAEVVQCADDLWASSVAKFSRAAALSDDQDGRVRGAFVFCGGSATGRASSYGLQVHNFPRRCADEPELVRQALVRGHDVVPQYGRRVTDVLKGMLRPALIPAPGKSFVVADWSSIEARVTPWCSGEAGEDKLELFRNGSDVYKVNAAATFRCRVEDVTKDQRQVGKVQELACGFAGGVGAFAAMGRVYGLSLPESEARKMVDAWRRANPWSVPYWQDLEIAYTRAIRNPKTKIKAGRVSYYYDGLHLWYALPSGRVLCYPYARIEEEGVTYAKASWKPAADAKAWPRARLWKGLACENITQATAADILRHALRELERAGLETVLHCHDEILLECPSESAEKSKDILVKIMCTPPSWCANLPLGAEASIMARYGKG
jgi:DNA polymerase